MKKIYAVLLFISFSIIANAQWNYVGNAFLNGTMRGLFFLNPDTGFAVGPTGTIAKTTDGGVTWDIQTPGIDLLRSVYFVDQDTGYVCGKQGEILKTIDGGTNWNMIYQVSTQYFRAIDFTSPTTGFVAGAEGTVLKTIDAGNSWTTYTLGVINTNVIQLDMIDALTGFAVCSDPEYVNGYVFKTIDGGESWSQVYSNADTGLLALAVVDADTVYAGGSAQMIIKTTDGGANWNQVYVGVFGDEILSSGFARDSNSIVMGDNFGNVLTTYDGGSNWTSELVGSGGVFTIFFVNSSLGYLGDDNGNVYKRDFDCVPPDAPGPVVGNTSVCGGSEQVYTVTPSENADSYTWTVPADALIISGQGDTSIVVQFGLISGEVTATSVSSSCGTGGSSSLSVELIALPQPTPIVGLQELCAGAETTYSTSTIAGVTDYQWSVPSDATIVSGQGDTSIVVQFGVLSGDVSVTANDNDCGEGGTATITVSVNQIPETAVIAGEPVACAGATLNYNTSAVPYADTYNWTVPDDATIVSGQGETSIEVTFGNISGDVTVTATSNSCGSGNTTLISVTVEPLPSAPTVIFGDTVFCAGDTAIFFINSVAGADSYTWSVPGSCTILSTDGDTAITVLMSNVNGFVKVSSTNGCGTSDETPLHIDVNPIPSPTITFSNGTLISSSPGGNQWYYNGEIIPGATSKFYTPTQNGDYYVLVTSPQGCSAASDPFTVIGVGVEGVDKNTLIEIYPNPTAGMTIVHFPALTNGLILINDVQGKTILHVGQISGKEWNFDASSFAKGVYLMRIFSEGSELIGQKKLVIQ